MNRRPPSRFEVRLLASELDRLLSGARVSNIYSNSELGLTLLKLNASDGPRRLLYERGLRVCLTDFEYPIQKHPHPQLRAARRILRRTRVEKVEQRGFDRVMSIRLRSPDNKNLELVLEVLSGGVLVILDSEGKIVFTTEKKVMRDRSIVLGGEYVLPPQTFSSPFDLDETRLSAMLREGSNPRSTLASELGLGNLSDVVCFKAGLDPDAAVSSISRDEAGRLLKAIRLTVDSLRPEPVVYADASGPVEFSLVPLPKPPSPTWTKFETISEAMDWYYSMGGKVRITAAPKPDRRLASLSKTADRLLAQSVELKEVASSVMADIARFDRVLSFAKQNTKGKVEGGVDVRKIDYREGTAQVIVDDREIQLDLSKSAAANASAMYSRSKELKARAEELLEEASRRTVEQKTIEVVLKRIRKRAWYEKFRWAMLSSSRKILLGKDAITNEILVRKHADEQAQVFHSDFTGSPFAVAWPPGEMTEKEIQEAADITASYTSKAWEMGFSSLDVYWVRGVQLSKSPPSGTYLARGAFYVAGEKNFVRGARLSIAVGTTVSEEKLSVVAMHPSASTAERCAVLAPGRHPNSEVSKKLAKTLSSPHSARATAEISDAIRERIPDKRSEIVSVKGL